MSTEEYIGYKVKLTLLSGRCIEGVVIAINENELSLSVRSRRHKKNVLVKGEDIAKLEIISTSSPSSCATVTAANWVSSGSSMQPALPNNQLVYHHEHHQENSY